MIDEFRNQAHMPPSFLDLQTMLRLSRASWRVANTIKLNPRSSILATSRPQTTEPPNPESRGFYKTLGVAENADHKEIAEAYQEKCDTLSEKLGSSSEAQMDDILEEIYLVDKAFKVRGGPS